MRAQKGSPSDGVRGEFFYEKNAPSFTPSWVPTFTVPRKRGGQIRYILLDEARTLVWAANLANLDIHPGVGGAAALRPVAASVTPGPETIISCQES